MLLRLQWGYLSGLSDAALKRFKDAGYAEVDILDANIFIKGLHDVNIGDAIRYRMDKWGSPAEAARAHIESAIESTRTIVGAIKRWKAYERASVPLVTDFTVVEVEHRIGPDPIIHFMKEVDDSADGLCAYLQTPFSEDESAREHVLGLLPKKMAHIAARHEDAPKNKENDMALYYIGYRINDSTDLKVNLISLDSGFCNLIRETNKLLAKPIYYWGPQHFIRKAHLNPK